MLSDKIQDWLNGTRNFIVGRAIYKQLGTDEQIKTQLQKGENAVTKRILAEAMEALLKKPVIAAAVADVATGEMPGSTDAILNALANEWKPLYARMNYLRGLLDKYGNSNTDEAVRYREPIAFEIIALDDKCEEIWAKRDHYLALGHLPAEVPSLVIPEDAEELGKLIEGTKRNIRRNRNKMNKPGADAKFAQLYLYYLTLYKTLTGKDYEQKD